MVRMRSNTSIFVVPKLVTLVKVFVISVGTFAALGTVTALWDNPMFIRMVPAGPLEIGLLAAQSFLIGIYFAIPKQVCSGRAMGVGCVLAFLGIACPICNKILLFVIGSELLLVYFEPVRIYVAAVGFLVTAFAMWLKWATDMRTSTA